MPQHKSDCRPRSIVRSCIERADADRAARAGARVGHHPRLHAERRPALVAVPLHWWAVPFIWLAWFYRGLRQRFGQAGPRPRPHGPGHARLPSGRRPHRCLCDGEGVITGYRKREPGVQFCAKMLPAFREQAGFSVVDTRTGPHWLAGFESERLVG
jgi:hypothetical protein